LAVCSQANGLRTKRQVYGRVQAHRADDAERQRNRGRAIKLVISGGIMKQTIRTVTEKAVQRQKSLSRATLSGATLSGVAGLVSPLTWMRNHFVYDNGWIVYKVFEANYKRPDEWKIEPGFITEVCNPLPVNDCACGINVATREWIARNHPGQPVWKCRIPEGANYVVPYNTDGKLRCWELELIELEE